MGFFDTQYTEIGSISVHEVKFVMGEYIDFNL